MGANQHLPRFIPDTTLNHQTSPRSVPAVLPRLPAQVTVSSSLSAPTFATPTTSTTSSAPFSMTAPSSTSSTSTSSASPMPASLQSSSSSRLRRHYGPVSRPFQFSFRLDMVCAAFAMACVCMEVEKLFADINSVSILPLDGLRAAAEPRDLDRSSPGGAPLPAVPRGGRSRGRSLLSSPAGTPPPDPTFLRFVDRAQSSMMCEWARTASLSSLGLVR